MQQEKYHQEIKVRNKQWMQPKRIGERSWWDRWHIIHTQKDKPHFPSRYCPISSFFYSKTPGTAVYTCSQISLPPFFFFNSFQSGSGFGISWELLPSYQWPLGCLIQWLVLSTNVTWLIIAFTMVNHFSILKHFLHLHFICLSFQDMWCSVFLPQWLLLVNLLSCFYLSDF